MTLLWDVEFKTRISGVAKVCYATRHMIIQAGSAKEATTAFREKITSNRGVFCFFGWELKTFYKAKPVSPEEAQTIMDESTFCFGRLKKIYQLEELKGTP